MLENKKFGVFGLGISGIATLKYLKHRNINFIAFDDSQETIKKIQKNYPEFSNNLVALDQDGWQEIDYLVLSPGIPLYYPNSHPVVQLAKKSKLISDIELLYLENKNSYFIGITGTNGKSTTTSLIGHILQYNNVNAIVCGNIGNPVLELDEQLADKVFVIEVSSFQLDLLEQTKFNIALLLNITPDHLDRHGSMNNYIATKYKIFNNQNIDDNAIINLSLEHNKISNITTFSELSNDADIVVNNNQLSYQNKNYQLPKNNSLLGGHNQQNLAAAIICCLKYGLSIEKIIEAIPSFVGLKHRMQYLGKINGVTFVNDSKATNADSTEKALASFENIIWIAGGVSKEGGIDSLKPYFPKVKKALLIGKAAEEFSKTCENLLAYSICNNLANAFKLACEQANPGDVILLSPACASYDQWKSFEERGEGFIQLFKQFQELKLVK